jgi:hypothetical protein
MPNCKQNQSKIWAKPYFFIEFTKITEEERKNCEKCRMPERRFRKFCFWMDFRGGKQEVFYPGAGIYPEKHGINLDG